MGQQNAESIFNAAREISLKSERNGFLNGACGNDVGMRAKVDALLKADSEAGSFLYERTDAQPSDEVCEHGKFTLPFGSSSEKAGQMIGRYKLLQPIGEGGFGSVWMAEQREPVKRRVALKIIKLGMDTKQVIARFEAERQALAMMDHPNIATVLDGGATDTGRPYFVMELVKGVSITEYCDTENLTTKQRLDLFIKVCNAVQHAHQKGIIHRDLKPSNVMVTLHDGKPVPKVIDFGIAKATNQELTSKTLFTEYRQFIGTPEYMSPEQAEMSGLDIDTRSDVYSLGVLLYELLTGVTPFDGKRLRSAAINEIQRIIREEEPSRPSTRLSELSNALPSPPGRGAGVSKGDSKRGEGSSTSDDQSSIQYIAKHRRTNPSSLSKQLRGDLDWIIMKALEKDRSRRYETANGFAADIQRYLTDEPVTASPPSASYKLKKLIKRNKSAFAAAAIVLLVLTLGITGTTWGMLWALDEQARVTAQTDRAVEALRQVTDEFAERFLADATEPTIVSIVDPSEGGEVEALARTAVNLVRSVDASRKEAHRELHRANEVKRLIAEMFDGITPAKAQGADITLLKSILDDTSARLTRGEIKDESIAAELHHIVGRVYESLGLYEDAKEHTLVAVEVHQRILGKEHRDTLESINSLAILYFHQGRYAKAELLYLETLEIRERVLGEAHPDTLDSMSNLAFLYIEQSRYAEAEPLFLKLVEIQTRALGKEHLDTLRSMNHLGNVYSGQSRYAEAEQLFLETLEIQTRVLGAAHPDTIATMNNLAIQYQNQGRYAKAEQLSLETLELKQRVLGEEHPDTIGSMNNLANQYRLQGRFAEAEQLYLEALERKKRVLGEEHPDTLRIRGNLASVYLAQGRHTEAAQLFLETLEILKRVLGKEHRSTLGTMYNLALVYKAQGRYDEAELLFSKTLEIQKRALGDEHSDTLSTMTNLAILLHHHLGRYADAELMFLEALEIQKRVQGVEQQGTLGTLTNLGSLYLTLERFDEAREMFEISLPIKRRVLGMGHPWTGFAIQGLAMTYMELGRREDALPLYRELFDLQIAEAEKPGANAQTLNNIGWQLLTHDLEELHDPARALPLAQRACALEEANGGQQLWMYLDTLALAQHMTGDTAQAIDTQKRAIALIPEGADKATIEELETNLHKYEAAGNALKVDN